ncbi:MAG TPA: hypothetical protein P5316_11965 [Phycisphaerae bacterium]|nr:hypothetical protein [Phycisphaerae bacterium]
MTDFSARLHGSPVSTVGTVRNSFQNDPVGVVVGAFMLLIAVEAGCLFLAWLLTPWGAVDELPAASFVHALRLVWLHTTHAVPLIFVSGTAMTEYNYLLRFGDPVAHDYAQQYGGYVVSCVIAACSAWFLWALFRATGASRAATPSSRPPTCDYCGYNLTGARPDGQCPECGVPVPMSLGSEARPGTACDLTRPTAFGAAMRRCWRDAVFRPAGLGRQIRVTQTSRNHSRCLTAILLPLWCVSAVAFALSVMAPETALNRVVVARTLLAAPVFGAASAAAVLIMALLIAAVVGGVLSRCHGRNLHPAAMQMQCYLGGFWLVWAVLVWVWLVCCTLLAMEGAFRSMGDTLSIDGALLGFLCWFLPCAAGVVVNFVLVVKGTAAARYANR